MRENGIENRSTFGTILNSLKSYPDFGQDLFLLVFVDLPLPVPDGALLALTFFVDFPFPFPLFLSELTIFVVLDDFDLADGVLSARTFFVVFVLPLPLSLVNAALLELDFFVDLLFPLPFPSSDLPVPAVLRS